uniref:TNF receptor-associated factor 3-like n=1 Tax=Saccoglossus kowalevskii TaxID=10224 RepID=A0ABM0MXA3_SACKO|nr:PREDICTED: TNF receptor-associated factor 3-like [Saccoglossus kowalevskii]
MPNSKQDPRDNGELHRCTRCEQILRSPVPTSCGHRFCEACLRVLATPRMPGRPLCQICSDDGVAEDFTQCDLAQSMNMQRSCSTTYRLNREELKKGFRVANESTRNRVRLEEIWDQIEKMEQRATELGALLEKYRRTHTYKRKLQKELASLEEKIQILEDSLRLTDSILESQDRKMVKPGRV